MFGKCFGTKQMPENFPFLRTTNYLMQSFLCRIKHITLRSYTRTYSTASARSIPSSPKSLTAIDQLEQDGARILRTVQKRVEERDNLLAQISEDMSSPEDIKCARQAKELEPLKMAWDEWQTNRQVHIFSGLVCPYFD